MKYLIALLLVCASSLSGALSYTTEFTEAELQAQIDALMPLQTNVYFATIHITGPELKLHEQSNEFSLRANIEVLLPNGLRGGGTTRMSGSVSYRPETGTFHLHNPTILDLYVQDVLDQYQPQIKDFAQLVVSSALTQYPIYTLQDDVLEQQLAKAALQSVLVQNGKLLVTFNLD